MSRGPRVGRRPHAVALIGLSLAASIAHGKCQVEGTPDAIDMGRLLAQQATDSALNSRVASVMGQISVKCPSGTRFRLRPKWAGDAPIAGDEAAMTNAEGTAVARVAITLASFDTTKVDKRFSEFSGGAFIGTGTGAPQVAQLKLRLIDRQGNQQRLKPTAGVYKLKLQFELQED